MDLRRVDGENVLAGTGVQAVIAPINVDCHRRVVHGRVAGGKNIVIVTAPGRGWCEEALDGDLVLPAFVQIRVHAGRRVESDHAGGQEKCEVVGTELYCLCALLPVRPFDCECGSETVTLQIDAVTAKPQRVVHGYFLVLPAGGIRVDLITDRIGHVRAEGIRLTIGKIVGGKVVYIQAVGVQAGAVEKQPGAE